MAPALLERIVILQRIIAAAALAFAAAGICAAAEPARDVASNMSRDMAAIERITGLKAAYSNSKEEGVYKVGRPRADVHVQVDGWPMPPFMGLGSWAGFTPAGGGKFLLMGDTVLFEDEVNPVMSVALDSGIEVTALHNHFFYDQPRVFFMHIGGTGTLDDLAAAVRKLYDKVDEIRRAHPAPVSAFPGAIAGKSAITPGPLESIFGAKGMASAGMFKIILGRRASMHGVTVGKEMGVNTWAAFAGSDEQAVVDGDIVMTAGELQAVLKSLRASGINIVAIHQHMAGEQPPLYFLHYWGKGEALALAQAVKQAISHTRVE
jgi:hypothetical protein